MENNLSDELCGRSFRQKKKPSDTICPVCSCTIRQNEMDQHFAMEVERLDKLSTSTNHRHKKTVPHSPTEPGSSKTNYLTNEECWGKFQKIKSNRQTRLKSKSRKRKAEETICPICNQIITENIQQHVELCLRSSNGDRAVAVGDDEIDDDEEDEDDDESIDVEVYEEYEWAGQTRVRASTLLPGGYAATGVGTNVTSTSTASANASLNNHHTSDTASDDELNVDGDDTLIFGEPQYSVHDIIMPTTADEDAKTSSYLRELVNGSSHPPASQQQTNSSCSLVQTQDAIDDDEDNIDVSMSSGAGTTSSTYNNCDRSSQQHIIDSLKSKINEYEKYLKNKPKCLICMDEFKTPVCSICCWHVHCEECWLKTLGNRKVCPQCNMITSPKDLRRIFM